MLCLCMYLRTYGLPYFLIDFFLATSTPTNIFHTHMHTLHMQQQPTSHSHALLTHTKNPMTTSPPIMKLLQRLLERRGAIDPTDHAYGFMDHLRACESVPDDVRPYFEATNFFLAQGFQEHSLVASVVSKWKVEDQYSAYCTETAFEEPEFVRLLALYNPSFWTSENLADILSTLQNVQAEKGRISRIRLLDMSNLFFNHVYDVVCGNDRLLDEDEEHTFDTVNDGVYFEVVNFFFEKGFRDEPLVERLLQQWNVQEKYCQHCVETGFWLQMVTKDSSREGVHEDNCEVVFGMFGDHLDAIVKGKWGKDTTFDTRRYIELLVHFERWAPTMSHGMTHEQKAKDCVYQFYTSLLKGVKQHWGIQHECDVVSGVMMQKLLTTDVDRAEMFHEFASHLEAIVQNPPQCLSAEYRQEYFRVLFQFQKWAKDMDEKTRLEKDSLIGRFLRCIDATLDYQTFATEQRGPPQIRRKGLVKN